LQFVKNDFNKENSFFGQGKVFDLVKVCFVFAFEKHAITIKNHSTTIKNTKEEGEKCLLEPGRLFLIASANSSFNCKCKDLQGGTLCGPVFCNLLKMILIKKQLF